MVSNKLLLFFFHAQVSYSLINTMFKVNIDKQ